jgi:hypothetical protein
VVVGFWDLPFFRHDGVEHFYGYYASEGAEVQMVTSEGFRVGSTLAELRAVYPETEPTLSWFCDTNFDALFGETITVDGEDHRLVAEFGNVPTPIPGDPGAHYGDPETPDLPLPPGFEETPVTAIFAGRITWGWC